MGRMVSATEIKSRMKIRIMKRSRSKSRIKITALCIANVTSIHFIE